MRSSALLAALALASLASVASAQPADEKAGPPTDAPPADVPPADVPPADAKPPADAGEAEPKPEAGAEPKPEAGAEPKPEAGADAAETVQPLVADTTVVETEADREARRRVSRQAAIEAARPRPDPEEVEPPPSSEWGRRLEIGGDFAMVVRPFANARFNSNIGYQPAWVAWGLHLHWDLLRWLRFHPYFIDAHHDLDIPAGALASGTTKSISADATPADTVTVTTFVFGAKLAPTLAFTERLRAWVAGGIGWGRFEFPEMVMIESNGAQFAVRERSGVFVEFPLGLGLSYDIIEDWIAIEYEASVAPTTGQSGSAYRVFQAIDAGGNLRDVGKFGAIEVSFVQTLGLSLIL